MAAIDRERRLKAVRDAMHGVLADGCSLTQKQLLGALLLDEYCGKNFTADALYVSIGAVVRTYDETFYRDPSTRKISLTRQALEWNRLQAGRQKRAAAAGGGTAAGHIGDAIEAREAIAGQM